MRIAFVVGSLAGGGAERVVSVLASKMAAEGNIVKVILIAANKTTYPIDAAVEIADCTKRVGVPGLSFVNRVSMIKEEINSFNADVTVSFTVAVNIYAILACMFSRRKLVVCERNDPRFDPIDKKSRFMRGLFYRFADGYVFQTTGERDYFSKKIQNKSVVIPNPISDNLPAPYTGERSKRIVSAGRLVKQKNYPMAIKAFSVFYKDHPDYVYEIYGDGPLKESLQQYAKECGVENSVKFMGTSKTLYTDILDSAVFVLSSDYEGLSNSMIEAMALGIPTVSTDYPSGGARDFIVNGENGFTVNCGDAEQLAEILMSICINTQNMVEVGKESAKIRQLLDSTVIEHEWVEYIKKIAH